MKAFIASSYGGPDVMTLGELPEPTPGRGQVVVAVKASSINPVDWKIRNGDARIISGWNFPRAYGHDFAGIITELGQGVAGYAIGDAVYGYNPLMLGKPGAHAERLNVPVKRLRRKPAKMSFEQAASLPVAGLTALNGLRQCGPLSAKSVIVNGATGGVGHFALQIAKARGALVTAVTSARNAERARSLGADRVLDYARTELARLTDRYDVIFDAFGHLPFTSAKRALEANGVYVSTLPNPTLVLRAVRGKFLGGKQIRFANVRGKAADYEALEQLVASGEVTPVVAHSFELQNTAEAFAAAERGGTVGKIVVRVER